MASTERGPVHVTHPPKSDLDRIVDQQPRESSRAKATPAPDPERSLNAMQAVVHNIGMATLQQKIAETFLAKLAHAKEIDADKLAKIKALLAAEKKPKVEDFVKVFSLPAGGDVK